MGRRKIEVPVAAPSKPKKHSSRVECLKSASLGFLGCSVTGLATGIAVVCAAPTQEWTSKSTVSAAISVVVFFAGCFLAWYLHKRSEREKVRHEARYAREVAEYEKKLEEFIQDVRFYFKTACDAESDGARYTSIFDQDWEFTVTLHEDENNQRAFKWSLGLD